MRALFVLLAFTLIGHWPLSSFAFRDSEQIPSDLDPWLELEQVVNARSQPDVFVKIDFTELPHEFDPIYRPVFEIGYFEIPEDEAFLRVGAISKDSQEILRFKKNGEPYLRFFVHPLMERNYKKLMEQYEFVTGEFLATPTASPRSLIIFDKKDPLRRGYMKLSLSVMVSGLRRINSRDKLERAFAVSGIMEEIPESAKSELRFDYLGEPAVISTGDRGYGNIVRDDFERFLAKPRRGYQYVPGFSLFAKRDGREPIAIEAWQESGLDPIKFVRKNFIEPLSAVSAYLSFQEGLNGEPHQQNVLFELDSKGRITGKLLIRDLDAFKVDPVLRVMKGKSTNSLRVTERPFKMHKLNKGGWYVDETYETYVRAEWSYLLEGFLEKVAQEGPEHRTAIKAAREEHKIYDWFDAAFFLRAMEHLGPRAVLPSLDQFIQRNLAELQKSFPEFNWKSAEFLPKAAIHKLFAHYPVRRLFSVPWNSFWIPPFIPSGWLENFKALYFFGRLNQPEQEVLREEYLRLKENFRTSTQSDLPRGSKFILIDGMILAVDRFRVIGTALLEPEATQEAGFRFYENSEYPRIEPNKQRLRKLIAMGDANAKQVAAESFRAGALPCGWFF